MSSLNTVTITGNLTKDAELKYTNSGLAIAQFSVAVNEREKKGNEYVDRPSFFEVTLFGKYAESINRHLTKGAKVGVQGKLKQERWEVDGDRRQKVKIHADRVDFIGGKKESQRPDNYGNRFEDDVPF